jgi:hypothetical protein
MAAADISEKKWRTNAKTWTPNLGKSVNGCKDRYSTKRFRKAEPTRDQQQIRLPSGGFLPARRRFGGTAFIRLQGESPDR